MQNTLPDSSTTNPIDPFYQNIINNCQTLSANAHKLKPSEEAVKKIVFDHEILKDYLQIVMTSDLPIYQQIQEVYTAQIFDNGFEGEINDEHLAKLARRIVDSNLLASYGPKDKGLYPNGDPDVSSGSNFVKSEIDNKDTLTNFTTRLEQFLLAKAIVKTFTNVEVVGNGSRDIAPQDTFEESIKGVIVINGVGIRTNSNTNIDGKIFYLKKPNQNLSQLTNFAADPLMQEFLNKITGGKSESFEEVVNKIKQNNQQIAQIIGDKDITDFFNSGNENKERVALLIKEEAAKLNYEFIVNTKRNGTIELSLFDENAYKHSLKNSLLNYFQTVQQEAVGDTKVVLQGLGLGVWAPQGIDIKKLTKLYQELVVEVLTDHGAEFANIKQVELSSLYRNENYPNGYEEISNINGISLTKSNNPPFLKDNLLKLAVIFVGDPSSKIGNELYIKNDEYLMQHEVATKLGEFNNSKEDQESAKQDLIAPLSKFKDSEKFKDKLDEKAKVEEILKILQDPNTTSLKSSEIQDTESKKALNSLEKPIFGSGDPGTAISCPSTIEADSKPTQLENVNRINKTRRAVLRAGATAISIGRSLSRLF